MKQSKKLFAAVLALILGLSCLSACTVQWGNSTGDTFAGKVSDEEFTTEDAAIQAFLKNELDGLSTKTELIGYEKEADLTAEELKQLPLGELAAEKIDHAERGTVSYRAAIPSNGATPTAATDATDDDVKTHGLYLLETEGSVRYFVPPTKVGEPITKSYFEDLLIPEKYENWTLEQDNVASGVYGQESDVYSGQEKEISGHNKIMFTKTGTYTETSMNFGEFGLGSYTGRAYTVIDDGKIITYQNIVNETTSSVVDEQWTVTDQKTGYEISKDEVRTLLNLLFISYDFSFYEKTDTGFKMNSYEKYLMMISSNEILAPILDSKIESYNNMEMIDFSSEFIVKDGRISEKKEHMSCLYNDGSISVNCASTQSIKFTNVGSTKITIPDSLKEYIAAQKGALNG